MQAAPLAGTLGIDFGTSNSAMAWAEPHGTARLIPLEGTAVAMPTAVFFNAEDQRLHFGRDAVAQYLAGTEGRLMRSLKSLLGSPLIHESTEVNHRSVSFLEIVTTFLAALRERAAQSLGSAPQRVVMGRPVHFVDDDADRDAAAQQSLLEAAQAAGFGEVHFQLEPIAAALDHERRLSHESLVLIADIGGGTDFDQRLSLEQVMPLMGYRHLGPQGREVPSRIFFDLSTWHLIQWQYQPRAISQAQALRVNYRDMRLHERLMRVLRERHGHHIAHEVEQAKIRASMTSADTTIDLSIVEAALTAPLGAAALRDHLDGLLAHTVACARECVQRAGLGERQPDAIYLTGGSSALRPFQQALGAAFPGVPLIEGDLFGGVASGLVYGAAPPAP